MKRNIKRAGIVLKRLPIGESNLGLTLLTEDDEIIFAMAFGAGKPKSKLFEGSAPFVLGNWDLYFDPVKEHWRGKDFSLIESNEALHTKLESFYTASFFAEVILKSHGSNGVFNLLNRALESMGKFRERPIFIQFLLRFIYEQGVFPDLTSCSSCYREIERESLFYVGSSELVCERCRRSTRVSELNPGMIAYMLRTLTMEFKAALKVGLSENSLANLKEFLILLLKEQIDGKLLTLDSCDGLI